MLRLDGHEVIIADGGKQAMNLVKEVRPDLVLMNVFRALHAGKPPVGKVSVQCGGGNAPVVVVNCMGECEQLGKFMAEGNDACDSLFDRLPAKVKIGAMEQIQHLCSTLSRYKRLSESNKNFDWHTAIQNVAGSCA
jgi:response regulator RpfG family c-di-GMP phosphodiesterase